MSASRKTSTAFAEVNTTQRYPLASSRLTASRSASSSTRSCTSIAGSSMGYAPSRRSAVTSDDAWERERVTRTRVPASGARRAGSRNGCSAATSPTTNTAGFVMPSARAMPAMVSRVPVTVPWRRRLLDERRWRRCVAAALDDGAGDRLEALDSHEDDEGLRAIRERLPAHLRLGLRRILVAGDHGERGGDAAMGDRDAPGGEATDRRGHARDHRAGHACPGERHRLLASAPEDVRVTALEAHDAPAGTAVLDEGGVRLVLGHALVVWGLSRVQQEGVRARLLQEFRCGQPVEHDHVGAAERLHARDRDEAGVTRAGADEPDVTEGGGCLGTHETGP